MYLVIELQKNSEGTLSNLVTTHETLQEADSKFHQVLSYAAVSAISLHSATILSERGKMIRNECYEHKETEQE